MSDEHHVRLDKWLWAARFFKHRNLAQEAIAGGHVHLNGRRVKPAHVIKIGDTLEITKANTTFTITVKDLADKRGSATQAALLYLESEESIKKREQSAEMRKLLEASSPRPAKRPDKKQRRHIIRFKQ